MNNAINHRALETCDLPADNAELAALCADLEAQGETQGEEYDVLALDAVDAEIVAIKAPCGGEVYGGVAFGSANTIWVHGTTPAEMVLNALTGKNVAESFDTL